MKFFIRKNLRIAKTRAYNLTVASRKKPAEFWSQGYIEEWAAPPVPTAEQKRAVGAKKHRATWVSWALWWPVQLLWRQCERALNCADIRDSRSSLSCIAIALSARHLQFESTGYCRVLASSILYRQAYDCR